MLWCQVFLKFLAGPYNVMYNFSAYYRAQQLRHIKLLVILSMRSNSDAE